MARPPDSAGVADFVGRADLLERVDRCLHDATGGWLLDVQGGPGTGKSTLLARLHREQSERDVPVAWTAMEGLGADDAGAFSLMLLGLGADLLPAAAVERLRVLRYEGGKRQDVQDAFVAALTSESRPRLLLVDDFHAVLDRPLVAWLGALFDALPPEVTVVVARRLGPGALTVSSRRVETWNLGVLDRADVEALLDRRVGSIEDGSGVIGRVLAFSGGHPLAAAVAADVLRLRGPSVRLDVGGVSTSRQGLASLASVLRQAIADAGRDGLDQAFDAACVLRRFDEAELAAVLDPGADAHAAMQWLETLSFASTTAVRKNLHLTSVHEFIREQQNEHLHPRRRDVLRQRGEQFLRDLVWREYEAAPDPDPYLRNYKIEDPLWQWAMGERSYLSSQREDRMQLGVDTAIRYFDAFWWWGCFLPFRYCEELLDEYEGQARPGEDQRWAGALRLFHTHYPPEAGDKSHADWAKVERALLAVRAMAGLESTSLERRHLRGITDIFLAQARREQDVQDPSAEKLYADAMEMLDVEADRWNLKWVEYELAQLWWHRGELGRTLDLVTSALGRAESGGVDCEIFALLYDLRARVAFQQGDLVASFDASASAMVSGYTFLAAPHPPDEYSKTWYELLCDKVLGRLRTLVDSGRTAEAAQAFSTLHDRWRAAPGTVRDPEEPIEALLAASPANLPPYLFPAGPTSEELIGDARDRYGRQARERLDLLHE